MPQRPPAGEALTAEQILILELVARDYTDDHIARETGLSKSSVQRRLRTAAHSMGASSRLSLVLCAIERGVIEQPRGLCRDANPSPRRAGMRSDQREHGTSERSNG